MPEAWQAHFANVELNFDAVDADTMLELNEQIWPQRRTPEDPQALMSSKPFTILRVRIGVQPVSGRLTETFYSAERENLPQQIQYKAEVHFDAEELWRVRVRLESAQGNAETVATVEATPPGYGRWDLLLYCFPFLAVGVLWAIAMIRKIRRRPGDRTPCQT